jgi:hypothetical protein
MTIVKYKVVASRPFNPLENPGVPETREEILLSVETPEKRKELIEWLVDTLDAQDASVPQSVSNAKRVAGLLEQLTQVEANRAVLARHPDVIPCLVKALDSETTIWPAALALDNLNQLRLLENKLSVVLYLLSNTSVLNTETPSERHQQLRRSLLSTTRGPIYTDAFKTALETYLVSLTVSNPESTADEFKVFNARAAAIMDFAEAVIPKKIKFSLYYFVRQKGVYFLRSTTGLRTVLSEVPDSDRKTTLMTQLGWNREFRDLDKHLPNPKILKDYEAELFQKLGSPDLGEVPHDHQFISMARSATHEPLSSGQELGTIYNDRGTNSALL